MGLKDFRIVFDNPWGTYYPKQTLTGRVIVSLDSPKKIRGIKVKVKGEANTSWIEEHQDIHREDENNSLTPNETGHEEYFNIQYNIFGSPSGDEIELPAGEHSYPFTCILPPDLPSSFEHEFGHVRYTVKAIIDRPWKFDHETKMAFTIVSNLDLNTEPRATESIHMEMSKTFCCLCCGSPPLNVNVILPVKGYVPGQGMVARVNVDNQSGVHVESIKLILRKKVQFKANEPRSATKEDTIIVAEVSKGPIEGHATADYEQKLDIPPLPPSNLINCGIIDLEYNFAVEVCVAGWYRKNLRRDTLIFIGTVPLVNYQSSIMQSSNKIEYNISSGDNNYPDKSADPTYGGYPSGYPQFSPGSGYPSAPPSVSEPPPGYNFDISAQTQPNFNIYPNLPPPSYEEAGWSTRNLRERGDSDHIMGNDGHFAPRYPVYNFTQ